MKKTLLRVKSIFCLQSILLMMLVFSKLTFAESKFLQCSDYKGLDGSCFSLNQNKTLSNDQRRLCEVCKEGKSCYSSLSPGRSQNFCRIYIEGENCFSTLSDHGDAEWCSYLKSRKSCRVLAKNKDRNDCEKGKFPKDHLFWVN